MQLQIILIKINQIQRNNYWVFSLTCVENSRILYRYIKPFVTCQEDLAKLQFSAPSAPRLCMRPLFLKLVLPHNKVMSTELRACATGLLRERVWKLLVASRPWLRSLRKSLLLHSHGKAQQMASTFLKNGCFQPPRVATGKRTHGAPSTMVGGMS